jgi:ADP-heptose:LPS heptosyltransferase
MSERQDGRVLVIKLSALGDFVLSIGAFQAIRAHHPAAGIVLLTTRPYAALAEASGCFDEVWLDRRPGPLDVTGWQALARRLRRDGFARVYDLQRSQRSGWYFRLLGRPRPEWVGVVPGCSHRYRPPHGAALHILDREAAQLALAGIAAVPPPDLAFARPETARFVLPEDIALLAPGGTPRRPTKRWSAARFAALAQVLARRGLTPVLLGTAAERDVLEAIAAACPEARDLCGRTDLEDIAALARQARIAVGNDTGPMHLIAAAGCPVVSLFSGESDPVKVAPRGPSVTVLRRPQLADLTLDEVLAALPPDLPKPGVSAKSREAEQVEQKEAPPDE